MFYSSFDFVIQEITPPVFLSVEITVKKMSTEIIDL